MNIFDFVIIAIIVSNTLLGMKIGLIKQIFYVTSFILGVIIAVKTHTYLASFLKHIIPTSTIWCNATAFILIFILVAMVVIFIGKLIRRVVRFLFMGWVDRLGGAIVGILGGTILAATLTFIFVKYPIYNSTDLIKNSLLGPLFLKFIEYFLESVY